MGGPPLDADTSLDVLSADHERAMVRELQLARQEREQERELELLQGSREHSLMRWELPPAGQERELSAQELV